MLAISVRLLAGSYRADDTGSVLAGVAAEEFPPSPLRLFAALVAAGGTPAGGHQVPTAALEVIERAEPPTIVTRARHTVAERLPRYVVRAEARSAVHPQTREVLAHMEYVGRTGTMVRPSPRVLLDVPELTYVWPSVDAVPLLEELRWRAARIGYLGTSDSPVALVVRDVPAPPEGPAWVPDPYGERLLRVPRPGTLAVLDAYYRRWATQGPATNRAQFPALDRRAAYRPPEDAVARSPGRIAAVLHLRPPLPGRRIRRLVDHLRAAMLARYQDLFGTPPDVLHGHVHRTVPHHLVALLPLPHVGAPYATGAIHGVALWVPDAAAELTPRLVAALFAVRRLTAPGIETELFPWEGQARPWAAHPRRWRGPARRWVTAFPAVFERFTDPDLTEVGRWCAHAGLPAPVRIRVSRQPLIPGALDLHPAEVHRTDRPDIPRRPYAHLALEFPVPVEGPVVVGAARSAGFGLCAPWDGEVA